MLDSEYASEHGEWIIDLRDVEDAKDLALEINPDSTAYEEMYKVNKDSPGPWICVIGRCDICGFEMVFFAPAAIYGDGITGCECADCGHMSLYPKEKNS